jgi:hypothetical protein
MRLKLLSSTFQQIQKTILRAWEVGKLVRLALFPIVCTTTVVSASYIPAAMQFPQIWTYDSARFYIRGYCKYLLTRISPTNTSIPQMELFMKTYRRYPSLPYGFLSYFEITMGGQVARLCSNMTITVPYCTIGDINITLTMNTTSELGF